MSLNNTLDAIDSLSNLALEYEPVRNVTLGDTETSILRSVTSCDVLDHVVKKVESPNILLVGAGLANFPILCPYVPYLITSHLESRGNDYQMKIVDAEGKVLEDIKSRTKLFLAYRHNHNGLVESMERQWGKYLTDTLQAGREITEAEHELNFVHEDEKVGPLYQSKIYLRQGMLAANVSAGFRTKINNGQIKLQHSDIAIADLVNDELYDYVDFCNVAYLMTTEGQKLALANISNNMRSGGSLLLNDLAYTGTPLFERHGGWLNPASMYKLGFDLKRIIRQAERSATVVLQKH